MCQERHRDSVVHAEVLTQKEEHKNITNIKLKAVSPFKPVTQHRHTSLNLVTFIFWGENREED